MAAAAPESFQCPITAQIMADPVTTADGMSYEREAIADWLAAGHVTSPLTGAPLAHAEVVPNHTLRSAIQEFITANPGLANDLYQPKGVPQKPVAPPPPPPAATAPPITSGSSDAAVDVSSGEAVPLGTPVAYLPVQAPPAPPITALTDEDRTACAKLGVADWAVYARGPPKAAASSGFFGFGKKTPRGSTDPVADYDPAVEPVVRTSAAEGGGIALDVQLRSQAQLRRLAMRLGAPGSAPVAALRLTGESGFGHGTAATLQAEGDGFALLCRVLRSAALGEAGASLGALRELSISAVCVSAAAAEALTQGLSGHPSVADLELWNVALEDAGALSVARLARADSNAALERLNLGRNLLHGDTRDAIEASIDRQRVRFVS